jgi:outer membrane cobalamin receptor
MERTLFTKYWLNFLVPLNAFSGDQENFSDTYGNEQTIAIATGFSIPSIHPLSVVTVITADEIKKTDAITIEEVLETFPGFHISSANGAVDTINHP